MLEKTASEDMEVDKMDQSAAEEEVNDDDETS